MNCKNRKNLNNLHGLKQSMRGSSPIPDFIANCPLVSGWCRYNGKIYYADLNYEASIKHNNPVFDLAYCATKALNGIYLMQREWNSKKFCRCQTAVMCLADYQH